MIQLRLPLMIQLRLTTNDITTMSATDDTTTISYH